MEASLLAALNEDEKLLVAETDQAALAALDEDGAIELEERIRQARDKYVSQYRRSGSARVAQHRSRGRARLEGTHARAKAEAFERALSQISRRVAVLARESAVALRAERLAAAKSAKQRDWPGAGAKVPSPRREEPEPPPEPTDSRIRTPASEKMRASTQAAGARKQARRDSRRSAAR